MKPVTGISPRKSANWLPRNDGSGPRTNLPLGEALHATPSPRRITGEGRFRTRPGNHSRRTHWVVTMHALLAWPVLGIVALAIFYEMLVPLVRQLWRRIHPSVSPLYGR